MFRRRQGRFFGGMESDPFWDDVVLLAGFNGVDGATAFNDESPAAHGAFTFETGAELDTDIPLFNEGTLLLNGSTGYVRQDDDADWLFGSSQPFTIEAWIFSAATGSDQTVVAQYRTDNSTRSWWLLKHSTNVAGFVWSLNGSTTGVILGDTTIPTTGFHHIAACRDDANVIRVFLNGTVQSTTSTVSGAFHNSTHTLDVGRTFASGSANLLNGNIAEVRITRAARYTTSFDVPTKRFPRQG